MSLGEEYDLIRLLLVRAPEDTVTSSPTLASESHFEVMKDTTDAVQYFQAIFGFVLALIIYFCVLCNVVCAHGEASASDVDKSIVKKKVMPHGQYAHFEGGKTESERKDTDPSRVTCFMKKLVCCANQKKVASHAHESAKEILSRYRLKNETLLIRAQSQLIREPGSSICSANGSMKGSCENTSECNDDCEVHDELVAAEEGTLCDRSSEMVCSICLEPYHIGEDVAWSKLEYCQHTFHYECILPWAVLGNMQCPVCREVFWSRDYCSRLGDHYLIIWWIQGVFRKVSKMICPMKAVLPSKHKSIMELSRFCVVHGLNSPKGVSEQFNEQIR